MNEQCNVKFQIGTYKYVELCDIIPMVVCHILLGRPWEYYKKLFMMEEITLIIWKRMGKDIHCHRRRMKQFQKVQGQIFC